MAKAPNIVIGLDLGRASLKSVTLQRRGPGRIAVTHYATRPISQPLETAEQLSAEIRALLREMGVGAKKPCAVAVSNPEAIIRIIEQPDTPREVLRDALRLNGLALLNQECREFVFDCEPITTSEALEAGRKRYLVGGTPRAQITQVHQALEGAGANVQGVQLAPVSLFNAFEFAQPELFARHGFFLVDIGYATSTMILGAKGELVLVRNVEVGGHTILEALMALSGESRESVLIALEQEDELMVENVRMALMNLTREIGSSIGFFEARREETISQIFVSGGITKSKTLVKVMSEELHMACTPWNPLAACEVAVPSQQREQFAAEAFDLHVACGAAAEVLNS
jgi:type IV pilus assembly protein PilM